MDRQTVYSGQLAQTTDLLKTGQNMMVGLAKFAAAVLGSTTIVNAFTVTPTGPASLNVIVTPGEIYQLENLEQSTWSSLTTDTHNILKQGILLDAATFGIVPPGTVSYSQNFLIEVQYQDVDAGSTVLPYFNASNPSVPFSGPGNAGTAQNTVRKGVAAIQVKAGTAAPTGTQTTPTADAGWTGIYVVTVANGATTITSGNITQLTTAPWIISTLPDVPKNVQSGKWTYGIDTSGTGNSVVVTLFPVPASYTAGMTLRVKMANNVTGASIINVNGLGNKAIVKSAAAALTGGEWATGDIVDLTYDGTNFQIKPVSQLAQKALTANTTFYVNGTTGSDTLYDGTSATVSGSAGPFKTIQRGINEGFKYGPSATYGITINVADGTYLEVVATPTIPGPAITIHGNTATPGNVVVNATGLGGNCISCNGPNVLYVDGLKVTNSTSNTAGFGANGSGSTLITNNTESGVIATWCFLGNGGGAVGAGSHKFTATVGYCFSAYRNGTVNLAGAAVFTFTTTFAIGYCAFANAGGQIEVPASGIPTFVNPGNVTAGTRYYAGLNGVVNTQGNTSTYFPGTTAGVLVTGGQYG